MKNVIKIVSVVLVMFLALGLILGLGSSLNSGKSGNIVNSSSDKSDPEPDVSNFDIIKGKYYKFKQELDFEPLTSHYCDPDVNDGLSILSFPLSLLDDSSDETSGILVILGHPEFPDGVMYFFGYFYLSGERFESIHWQVSNSDDFESSPIPYTTGIQATVDLDITDDFF